MTDTDPQPGPWTRVGTRRRALLPAVAVFVLLSLGVLVAAGSEGPAPRAPAADAGADAGADTDRSPSRSGDAHPAADRSPSPARSPRTVAISTQGGLSDGLAETVASEQDVEVVTVVRGATLGLIGTVDADGEVVDELPDGWRFPLEVLAVDPDGYHEVLGVEDVLSLAPDEGLLSESSAEVRRLGPGGELRFRDGTRITVVGVLPDELVGAAELLVPTESPLPVTTDRYLLARTAEPLNGPGRARLLELAGGGSGLEVGGEVPVLRHAAGVMPPARLKVHFGEFAYTDGPGRWIHQGASWLREYYAEESVPILGATECHRDMFPPLRAAMQELVDRGLAHLVDADDYGGCWAPRTQGSAALSSHAWGIAVDLNVAGNHYGAEPTMPEEIVEVMAAHGFTWGGDWPVPDGMHFELVVDRELPIPGQ
ncbi:MAG: M15 family peptidase [Nitriliruptor sp.]|nr:MAG: M15 family peptidase [Nitriliruptor sp.]